MNFVGVFDFSSRYCRFLRSEEFLFFIVIVLINRVRYYWLRGCVCFYKRKLYGSDEVF